MIQGLANTTATPYANIFVICQRSGNSSYRTALPGGNIPCDSALQGMEDRNFEANQVRAQAGWQAVNFVLLTPMPSLVVQNGLSRQTFPVCSQVCSGQYSKVTILPFSLLESFTTGGLLVRLDAAP